MKKTIMVDVDGVLVSGRPADGQHWTASLKADLGISPADLKAMFFEKHWAKIQLGQSDLLISLTTSLVEIGSTVSARELSNYWFANDSRINRELLSECNNLRDEGYSIWLATNQDHERAEYLMSELRLSDHFDGIVYSAALGLKKPDEAFFRAAEKASEATSSDIIYIDDTEKNVVAARNCGWNAFLWTQGVSLQNVIRSIDRSTIE
jgi:putative hydrolase of the HAD superfamily